MVLVSTSEWQQTLGKSKCVCYFIADSQRHASLGIMKLNLILFFIQAGLFWIKVVVKQFQETLSLAIANAKAKVC